MHTGGRGERGRAGARRADHRRAVHAFVAEVNAHNPVAVDDDPSDRAPLAYAHPFAPGGARITLHDRLRSGVTVERAERRADEPVQVELRDELAGGLRSHELDGDTQGSLHGCGRSEQREIGWVVEQKQVPHLLEEDLAARELGESRELIQ